MITQKPSFTIAEPLVESARSPLGIECVDPRFSFRMQSSEPSKKQFAYQIIVENTCEETAVWDSGKVFSSCSNGIVYGGAPLAPRTRYDFTVNVWDEKGEEAQCESFFETGLMEPSMEAFMGAKWIGAPRLNLMSSVKGVFRIETRLQIPPGSQKAGLVFGAKDKRLLDRTKNPLLCEGENYICYELDVSSLPATLSIYRVGYWGEDREDVPFVQIPLEGITEENRHDSHLLAVEVYGNHACAFLDGACVDSVEEWGHKTGRQLNPLGRNDVIGFPYLNEVGFYAGPGSRGLFYSIHIADIRTPKGELFHEEPDGENGLFSQLTDKSLQKAAWVLDGGSRGKRYTMDPSHTSTPMLRRVFHVLEDCKVLSARAYVTARGIYEGEINGQPLSKDRFAPGASQFDKHLYYQIYDVTNTLRPGENALGFTLASGWWSDSQTYTLLNHNYFGDRPSLLMLLEIRYGDGRVETVVSDPESFRYSREGPVLYASNFNGEHYDARREEAFRGFSLPGFDDADWESPVIVDAVPIPREEQPKPWPAPNHTTPALEASFGGQVYPVKTFPARSMEAFEKGRYIYDMGQNMAGVPRIRLHGEAGQAVTLRFAEMCYPDHPSYPGLKGLLLTENLRDACCTDVYICKGDPDGEWFEPRLTFHGYRYLEVSGVSAPPSLDEVLGVVLSSIDSLSGDFTCSDSLVNRLYENIRWSQYANFLSIPTDCPQRNERLGWMGDAQVFAPTASYNADMRLFYPRYLQAVRDLQTTEGQFPNIAPVGGGFGGIAWESAGILIPWALYRQYGDLRALSSNYEAMCSYVSFLMGKGWPGILTDVGPLGDWLASDMETDNPLLWNAIFAYDVLITARSAKLLGKEADAARYEALFQEIKALWNRTFVNGEGKTCRMDSTVNDTQCSYALPLRYGLFDDSIRKKAAAHLADRVRRDGYTVTCGFLGTPHLNPVLCEYGYTEEAYKLLRQTEYPSWLYPVTQGATTIWERWNSYTYENGFGGNNSMNSFNHYSLGAVGEWLYESVLGISPDEENGYQKFHLKPLMEGLDLAKGHYDCVFGRIESGWTREGNRILYDFSIPANTEALVELPFGKVIGGEGLQSLGGDKEKQRFSAGSGSYHLEIFM